VIGIEKLDNIVFPKSWSDSIGSKIQKAYKDLITEKTRKEKLHPVN